MPEIPGVPDALNSLYQQAEAAIASLLSRTHFLFEATDQPKGTFKVVRWQSTEKISSSYRYTLNLITHGIVDETQILGKDACLSINRQCHNYPLARRANYYPARLGDD